MLSRPLPPDPRSSLYPVYPNIHPTPTHPAATHSLPFYPPYRQSPGLAMDPTSVDFRAFYPYTPNEVKHRKRTTTAQLKTLETVFKRDTKPNGPLRVELATKLGMTARGVQVWFQNRRAKEKIKAVKAGKGGLNGGKLDVSAKDASPSLEDAVSTPDSPKEAHQSLTGTEDGDSSSQSSSPAIASPPHTTNEFLQTSWNDSVPPNPIDSNLHAYRRGSLPVDAFPHTQYSANSPPTGDTFDPFARRLSVDASLQRLANNPYAHLARAKNGAVFGPRATALGRHRQFSRTPYGPHPHRTTFSNMPYRLDMRRASMDSRAFRLSPGSAASPSPSPLSPYIRGSLPDNNLYAVTARTVSSPIPGPLPSPNFSFGAASTPSMASASSGDSERNSPDSLQSFTFRGEEADEEDSTIAPYDYHMRFGSIASVATSDSSLNSAYYQEIGGCATGHERGGDYDHNARRDSCASGFLTLMSGLDVNGMSEPMIGPLDHGAYAHRDDLNATDIIRVDSNGNCVESSTYPSPTSTVSPGIGGSPHAQNALPSSVPISRSSELAFALQSQSDQIQGKGANEQVTYGNHPAPAIVEPEVGQPQDFFYVQEASVSQPSVTGSDTSLEYRDKYEYDLDTSAALREQYDSSASSYSTDGYSVEGEIGIHQHISFDHRAPVSDVYNSYGEVINPSLDSPLENSAQNGETFVNY